MKRSIRTDLASESTQAVENEGNLPEGIEKSQRQEHGFEITRIDIKTKSAQELIGKPCGTYYTLKGEGLSCESEDTKNRIELLAEIISSLCKNINSALVIGLGNRQITPDSIGPKVCDKIIATRHIKLLAKDFDTEGLLNITAVSPGVLGQTGIEAGDIAKALVEKTKPDIVIAVDALACSELSNLGCTIQLCDTGIVPGSGVENARRELSEKTLGIPCIAIGIPTVIDMDTIAFQKTGVAPDKTSQMMVTPRNIDALTDKASRLISMAINKALNPDMPLEQIMLLSS